MKRIDVTDDYYAEYNEHSMEWNCLQIITIYFMYYNWSLVKNNVCCIKFGNHKETKIW